MFKLCGMKVYIVVAESDDQDIDFDSQVIGVYKNEDDATEKVADIMQEIEAYNETFPNDTGNDEVDEKAWRLWRGNYPHKINDVLIDTAYLKEFELM